MWPHHSKREKLACIADFARWRLGLLNRYLHVDYSNVDRVVFVCKGNICRSAYGEAKFNMLSGGAVSAGTEALDGGPANEDAIRVGRQFGVDLLSHRTRNIRASIWKKGDLFVCMEKMHADVVVNVVDMSDKQILLLGGLNGLPRVSDPYGRSDEYFSIIFARINQLIDSLVARRQGR